MRILGKQDENLLLIATPEEDVRIGDIFQSGDILSQTLDLAFADLPGILEHILRQSLINKAKVTQDIQPEVKKVLESLSDQKLVITKIRGHLEEHDGKKILKPGLTEFKVSREKTEPKILSPSLLFEILNLSFNENSIAKTMGKDQIDFDFLPTKMGINLITGQKGSGKSYFSKRLLLKLIRAGVLSVVFDINGEYQHLHLDKAGNNPSEFSDSITILDPMARNARGNVIPFRIPLSDLTAQQFCKYMRVATDATQNAIYQYWNDNRGSTFNLDDLETHFMAPQINQLVRNAIRDRIQYARSLQLFGPLDLRQIIQNLTGGGALIINLFSVEHWKRELIVNLVQRWLERMAESNEIRSLSLFLEEAQSYVTGEDFIDLLTRMRHIGIYPTFITNDPTTLPDEVFSLADNIVSFRFKSDQILKHLARTGMIDNDTVKTIRRLDNRQCLVVGKFSNDFPLFLEIGIQTGVKMAGETIPLVPN